MLGRIHPFEKKQADFANIQEYETYIEHTIIELTIDKQFESILNLLNRPKKSGYYIFRVKGINFQNTKELIIWNAAFYNPIYLSKLNTPKYHPDLQDYIKNIELYFDDNVNEVDKPIKQSTCNLIISTEYRPLYFSYTDNNFNKAIFEANNALIVLKNLYKSFIGNNLGSVEIDYSSYILADENLEYISAPKYKTLNTYPFQIDENQEEVFKQIINGMYPPQQRRITEVSFCL